MTSCQCVGCNELDLVRAINAMKYAIKEGNFYRIQMGYWDDITYIIRKLAEAQK